MHVLYCNALNYIALHCVARHCMGLITILEAILTSRQPCEKLQSLCEDLMLNKFPKTAFLKKI